MSDPFATSACPVARTASIVGDKWTLLILRDAFDGLRRFGEFQANLGIARNILSDRLARLCEHGLLEQVPGAGAYREYQLTDAGRDLFTVLVSLRQWGEAHRFAPGEPHSTLRQRATGRTLAKLRVTDREGHAVQPEDTEVRKVRTSR